MKINYAKRIARLQECLGIDTGITAQQFKLEAEHLWDVMIQRDPKIVSEFNIVLPVVLPKLVTGDLGIELQLYLEGVGKSYAKITDREFHNYYENELDGKVKIVPGSHHNQLIKRMKQGSLVGIHLSGLLRGEFEPREQYLLSGMDIPIVVLMFPDLFGCDHNQILDMTALSWRNGRGLALASYKTGAEFNITGNLLYAGVADYARPSYLFLG